MSDMWIIIAAVLGVAVAFEGYRHDPQTTWIARVLLLVTAIGVAGSMAETWREFLYGLLMPIGAYKVARVLADPIAPVVRTRWEDRSERRRRS